MSSALTRAGRAISLVGWFIVDRAQAWLCAVSTRRLIVAAERRLLLDTASVQV
jgi:hypothetical protein